MSTPITNLCARAGYTYQAANIANAQRELNAGKVNLSGMVSKFAQTQMTLTPGSEESKRFENKIQNLRLAETKVKVAKDANAVKKQLIAKAMGDLNSSNNYYN